MNQNKGWKYEREGGYLFAPIRDSRGGEPAHWSAMKLVTVNDVIFSYRKKAIIAIAAARGSAYEAMRPYVFDQAKPWMQVGRRIDVTWRLLAEPLELGQFSELLMPLMSKRHSPLSKKGSGVQGYLYSLEPAAAQILIDLIGKTARLKGIAPVAVVREIVKDFPSPKPSSSYARHARANHWINAAIESAVLLLRHRIDYRKRVSPDELKVYESVSRELLGRTIWKYSEA
ncbi:MAG: hypothetical protein HY269_10765, partial [Deltaproteobacteria bacterium]|nr:hypothetical protein [Deltaproteobacteria bacterium]